MLSNDLYLRRWNRDIDNMRYVNMKLQGKLDRSVGVMPLYDKINDGIKQGRSAVLLGHTGIGKTMTALEIAYEIKDADKDNRVFYNRLNVLYATHKGHFSDLAKTLEMVFDKESFEYPYPKKQCKVVIIDEIHNCDDSTLLNEIIYHAYDKFVPLILIGNLSVDNLNQRLTDMARSRLQECGDIYNLDGKDLRQID